MAVYEYKGLLPGGKAVSGIINADSLPGAQSKLRQAGVFPTDLREGIETVPSRFRLLPGFKTEELAALTRQLATLIKAGIPLAQALSVMAEQVEKPYLKRAVIQTREKVIQGSSLADAMRERPDIFSELYANMVMAGEASGTLDIVLIRLAEYLEGQARLKSKVLSALAYPLLLLTLGGGVLAFLVAFVVPRVSRIFEDFNRALPAPTLVVIAISDFIKGYWWLIAIALAGITVALRYYLKSESGKGNIDRLAIQAPILGGVMRQMTLARFSRTLSTLLMSGVAILTALEIVRSVVNNRVFSQAIDTARDAVKEGEPLAEPLKRAGLFPPLVTQMVAAGEQSGQLDGMLASVADLYESQLESRIIRLTSLMEPIMILIMGSIVGFIVLSILLPILEASRVLR